MYTKSFMKISHTATHRVNVEPTLGRAVDNWSEFVTQPTSLTCSDPCPLSFCVYLSLTPVYIPSPLSDNGDQRDTYHPISILGINS